jgi:preprotein translocase subunit SecE
MAKANLSFIREAREELKKVSWPSRETAVRYTVIVIVGSLAVSLVVGAMDYVLSAILKSFIFS